jgi:hypothetical protein
LKVRADEHVSPKIVETIRSLVLTSGWELSHVRDHHRARTADETWLPLFAEEGGKAILSADATMLKRPHQLMAVRDSGLICVLLSSRWAGAKRHEQAAGLLYHWPAIEAVIAESKPGDCWRVPAGYDGEKLTQHTINYGAAANALDASRKPAI